MKVRIIKSNNCNDCKLYLARLNKLGFVYETMDGDDLNLKDQMDAWKIDKMPVVQIINDNGEMVDQLPPGSFSVAFIQDRIRKIEAKSNDSKSK